MSSTLTSKYSHAQPLKSLPTLGAQSTLLKYLVPEDAEVVDGSRITPRQVTKAHYTKVLPEPVPHPTLLAYSQDCAKLLNLDLNEVSSSEFVSVFAGNKLAPNLDQPYCTVYGCHSGGQWFGQLGDGRAISLGEVHNLLSDGLLDIQELQLKGAGRSPYSRGFDGRAVLRSSVREYLASEAMHHLGVPTTRALTLVSTGEQVVRPWYASSSSHNPYKPSAALFPAAQPFPPDTLHREPGAIVCRVARSFLRFGHLELWGKRKQMHMLIPLLNLAILREFPMLLRRHSDSNNKDSKGAADGMNDDMGISLPLPPSISASLSPAIYLDFYRELTRRVARLAVQWERVGYVQGNMNSDNIALGGRTIDYGPFGFVEVYQSRYQPFTSDRAGQFAFREQGRVMGEIVQGLGEEVLVPLIRHVCKENCGDSDESRLVAEVRAVYEEEFDQIHEECRRDMIGSKLGLFSEDTSVTEYREGDDKLYDSLLELMEQSKADYTILFRELGECYDVVIAEGNGDRDLIKRALFSSSFSAAFYDLNAVDQDAWVDWFIRYMKRVQASCIDATSRLSLMRRTNPKYILRNWMLMLAYEGATRGDMTILKELEETIKTPYGEGDVSTELAQESRTSRWYQKTPPWARDLPGATFLSCSS
eukprot:gene28799-34767_t